MSYGPRNPISQKIHQEKYRIKGESFDDFSVRIANGVKDDDEHFHRMLDIVRSLRWLPAGRQQLAVGNAHQVTAFNCLSGDTHILTREYGSVPIREVAGRSVHLMDGNGDWTLCPIIDHGEQETVELTFKGGFESVTIRSTWDHGWINPGGETVVRTKALAEKPGKGRGKRDIDYLRPAKSVGDDTDYSRGVVHGLIYGDGTKTPDGAFAIRVCDNHEEICAWLDDYSFSTPPSSGGDPHYRIKKAEAWSELKELPKGSDVSSSYLLGFMRGWFAADGCVSTQPEATLCGDESEMEWVSRWAPVIGWQVRGFSLLAEETNFGARNKRSGNIRFKRCSMDQEDFLLEKHASRWSEISSKVSKERSWRVHGPAENPRMERVYCPVVPSTHSFALPNGIHSANCFVSDIIPDDSRGIFNTLTECFQTMRMGGGVGMDFSTLRPNGALIKTLASQSSGPVSFMKIWDAACSTVQSKGLRRGAMMAVIRVDHPDIQEFIRCKKIRHMFEADDLIELVKSNPDMNLGDALQLLNGQGKMHQIGELTNFNVSVGITDAFMDALVAERHEDQFYDLKFEGQSYGKLHAPTVWEEVMRNTWDFAEPGVLFVDRINKMNPLGYCETISATNPCGEQPLPPHGACLLGSMNATAYIKVDEDGQRHFDFEQFKADIPDVIRSIDNIIDRTNYPLPQQEREAKMKRRMGLGITGLANTIELVWGHKYGSDGYIHCQNTILEILRNRAYAASSDLAQEKGSFPLFDADRWLASGFAETLPRQLRERIKKNGLRNGLLLSIAPTGTISLCADNISSGIEPPFLVQVERDIITDEGKITVPFNDWAYERFGFQCTTANEISVQDHVRVLCAAQAYVDSSISKTCNVGDHVTFEEFKQVYINAYKNGAKGCTTFRAAGKRAGMMREIKDKDFEAGAACYIDPTTGQKECA